MVAVRQLLISFLVVLQVLIPLLHAHSGAGSMAMGIHVPGLEALKVTVKPPEKLSVAKELCEISAWCTTDNGVMVAVDTGIRVHKNQALPRLYPFFQDSGNSFYLQLYLQQTVIFKPLRLVATSHLAFVATLLFNAFVAPHLSRAPPLSA